MKQLYKGALTKKLYEEALTPVVLLFCAWNLAGGDDRQINSTGWNPGGDGFTNPLSRLPGTRAHPALLRRPAGGSIPASWPSIRSSVTVTALIQVPPWWGQGP